MLKKYKVIKILIAIIIFIILIISFILITKSNDNQDEDIENPKQISQIDSEYKLKSELQEFDDINMYFVTKNIIERFYTSCSEMNYTAENVIIRASAYTGEELQEYKEKMAKEKQDEAIEKVYNMLSEDYIREFKVNNQDIKEKFNIENNCEPIIEKIYRFQNSTNVWTYLIKGINVDIINKKSENLNIGLTVDILNKTFCIYPQEYLEKHEYDKLQLGDEIEEDIEEIEKNTANSYIYEIVNDQQICEEYFNKTKKILLYDADFSYEMLDDEYKEKKFENIEQYKEWLQKNQNNIASSVAARYKTSTEKGVKEYICQDTNDNYFVFKKSKTVDFKIYLDTYTIPLNEFVENYNKADEKEKVKMNIQNIFQAINRKDYSYVYNYLDETFKQNNFDNIQKLEDYLKNNLYDINEINGENYSNEGEVHIYNLAVTHKNKDSMRKKMNINMLLKEDNDFVFSFDIK